jgi:4-hydroxybenzoate polyprenyltransferase
VKRYTYWPQLFLGFTFNWGIVMAWTSITNEISYLPILLYVGAIFWTLGYDTIYGIQDISDDEVIGVKSTAIKFKNNLNLFIGSCYLISSAIIFSVMMTLKANYCLVFLIFFIFSLFYQIRLYDLKKPKTCLKAFKLNNLSGLTVFLGFVLLTINV